MSVTNDRNIWNGSDANRFLTFSGSSSSAHTAFPADVLNSGQLSFSE